MFSGFPQKIAWNDTQLYWINTTQIYALMEPFTDEARHRYISKLYIFPITDLKNLANAQNDEDKAAVMNKMGIYRMYSAHDFQIANILYQLNPSFNFTYIKYASTVYFELYRQKEGGDTFYVKPIYNGQNFPINGCNNTVLTSYREDSELEAVDGLCELNLFLEKIQDVLITDEDNLKSLCNEDGMQSLKHK